MKVLLSLVLGLVGLVVLAVLVLFAMSMRPKAGWTEASVEVNAPIDTAFAWVTEPEHVKQWVSWLVDVRQDRVTPDGVGSRETWIMDDPNMKKRVEVASEVTRYEPPRRVDVRISMSDGFDGDYTYVLEPTAVGTKITMSGAAKYRSPLIQLMEPLVTPAAQKKMEDDFVTLKRKVEAAR